MAPSELTGITNKRRNRDPISALSATQALRNLLLLLFSCHCQDDALRLQACCRQSGRFQSACLRAVVYGAGGSAITWYFSYFGDFFTSLNK